jgi:hypothetical protein
MPFSLQALAISSYFTKNMGSMSREKLEKMGNFAKNFVLIGLFQPKEEPYLLVKN